MIISFFLFSFSFFFFPNPLEPRHLSKEHNTYVKEIGDHLMIAEEYN